MTRRVLVIVGAVSTLIVGLAVLGAQETPKPDIPTPEELTLRPGDIITLAPQPPHRVQFGGTVTHNNVTVTLTSFGDIQKILDVSPQLAANPQGVAVAGVGVAVTGKVKTDAPTSGVMAFAFTC